MIERVSKNKTEFYLPDWKKITNYKEKDFFTPETLSDRVNVFGMQTNSYPKHPEKVFCEPHSRSPKYQESTSPIYPPYPLPADKRTNWNYNSQFTQSNLNQHYSSSTPCSENANGQFSKEIGWMSQQRKNSFSSNCQDESLPDSNPCKKSYSESIPKALKQNVPTEVLKNGRSLEASLVQRHSARITESQVPALQELSPDARQSSVGVNSDLPHTQNYHAVRQSAEAIPATSTNPTLPNFGYSHPSHNFSSAGLHFDPTNLSQDGFFIGSSEFEMFFFFGKSASTSVVTCLICLL